MLNYISVHVKKIDLFSTLGFKTLSPKSERHQFSSNNFNT